MSEPRIVIVGGGLTAARVVQGALLVRLLTTALTPHPDETASDDAAVAALARLLLRGLVPRHDATAP